MKADLGIVCALLCCTFSLITTGRAEGEHSHIDAPVKGSSPPYALHLSSAHSINSNAHVGMNLSGNSSSPVEPIKPLLKLGDVEGSLTLPAYPVFDKATPTNVTAMTGNAAYLHCLVHNLGNKSVSWIRQRDIHILTVGLYTYTTDQRYEVIHSPGSEDWILKIKYAQVRDSGYYECQVSTKPVKSYTVHLHVSAPKVEIIGSPDMHVDTGSTINLTCIIAHSPEPPSYIFWYHNNQVVTFDTSRGSISTPKGEDNVSISTLLIQEAQPSDTGNYTCASSNNAKGTTLRVHVFSGDPPAAMQTNGGVALLTPPPRHAFYTCLLGALILALLTEDLLLPGTFRGGGEAPKT